MNEWMRPSVDRTSLMSQAMVLMGNFNHLDTCWRNNTDGHMQSWRFLENIRDKFLTQMLKEPVSTGALLDLVITNKEGLVEDVKVEGSLG